MEDLNLPEIKRRRIQEKNEDKKEFKGLFESDSDSDSGELMQKRKGNIFQFHHVGFFFLSFFFYIRSAQPVNTPLLLLWER